MTEKLDLAIHKATIAHEKEFHSNPLLPPVELPRIFARALIAELLRGMEKDPYERDASGAKTYSCIGFNAALAEIKRRAGLEGEG